MRTAHVSWSDEMRQKTCQHRFGRLGVCTRCNLEDHVYYEQEVERLTTENAALKAELAKHQESQFHPDWSMLEAGRQSLRELAIELECLRLLLKDIVKCQTSRLYVTTLVMPNELWDEIKKEAAK